MSTRCNINWFNRELDLFITESDVSENSRHRAGTRTTNVTDTPFNDW
jgi:hypothetical protein